MLGVPVVTFGRAVQCVVESNDELSTEAGDEQDVRGIVDPERRRRRQIVGDTPAAEVLARSRMGGLRPGCVPGSRFTFDDQAVDTPSAQLDGCSQTAGPGADDEDLG